ncbi:hypothetical protein PFISCL1PPCAC_10399, partial [Pristionchus fissidentatus]
PLNQSIISIYQLRPITFAAERESQLAENLENLVSFWLKATFDWTTHTLFNLRIPTNLLFLKDTAQLHLESLRAFSKGEVAMTRETINEWWVRMERVLSTLTQWEKSLSLWITLCFALERNKEQLSTEYD